MRDDANRQSEPFLSAARATSRAAGAFVMLVGALVLIGWEFDVDVLKGLYGEITMKANAAVAFVLVGASLLLLHLSRERLPRRAGEAAAALAGLIGAATLGQHLLGWDLGIDQLLFTEAPGAAATASPGRMGPPASSCLALAGLALVALHRGWPARASQLPAITIALVSLLPITGYAYDASVLYGVAKYTGIALHTAVTLLVLAVGLLASSADRGVVAVVASTGAGSLMARRLLPFAIAVPLLLGWIRVRLEDAGYFEARFGLASLMLATIVILTTLIVSTAARFNRLDERERVAEREREQLLVSAERAREQAEAANRSKDEFLATISHELRTPLSAIVAWACMLRDEIELDEKTRDTALATIERNAKAQSQLIDDLLDISRIVAGKLRLDVAPMDLSPVLQAAVDVVLPAAQARAITLRTELEAERCVVRGDPGRLQQVVWNLLTNAVKFTPRGGTVIARLSVVDSDAVIAVSDTGDGIEPEFMPHLFERFSQGDGRKTRRHGGLGIGLSIVRHLVEMHGGTIEAASPGPGMGSTFTVRLPLLVQDAVAPLQSPLRSDLARSESLPA